MIIVIWSGLLLHTKCRYGCHTCFSCRNNMRRTCILYRCTVFNLKQNRLIRIPLSISCHLFRVKNMNTLPVRPLEHICPWSRLPRNYRRENRLIIVTIKKYQDKLKRFILPKQVGILTKRKVLSTERPLTPSKSISRKLKTTIKKSKQFHPSLIYWI